MITKFLNFFAYPYRLHYKSRELIKKYQLQNYEQRLAIGAVERPHYGYCVYHSAKLAKRLGYERISVIEFGVAGGNGLVNLEYHVEEVSKIWGIEIEIYGFDTGEGLPKPVDYRDLPYYWQDSFFKMDISKLQPRLKKAQLVLGNITKTAKDFFEVYKPAPIAAIMYDLDYYSSTVAALEMFDADDTFFLPRIFCYFDDIIGSEMEAYNDYIGVRLAINEFNQNNQMKKLGKAYHLLTRKLPETWYNQIYIYHNFSHSKYNEFIGPQNQQIVLEE